jgi:hypothetical protein
MPEKKSKAGAPAASQRLQAAAKLIGSPVERFIAWKELPDGSLVVIDYDGRKYQFRPEELE